MKCFLCKKDIQDTAYGIYFDPEHEHNLWGGDTYKVIADICMECGDKIDKEYHPQENRHGYR